MIFAILCILSLFLAVKPVYAISDPFSVPNNKYGMHIADTNDIADVAPLVNSTNGDWGYVTIVIPDSDMNHDKWQNVFDSMRRKHLIPIVRIATHAEQDAWKIPESVNIDKWVDFLDKLNWPVENRYVVLFNEPNHAKEWGNTIDPEGYGKLLIQFSKAFKSKSDDFFILPAGLDASATKDGEAIDEPTFLTRMVDANPDIFSAIDGWTSHAYPNPAFSGSPYASGRGTIQTFVWEKSFLQELGLQKKLPIFITETGWEHREGKFFDTSLLSSETVASDITVAANSVWSDPDVAAVTPFVFNYQDHPFDHFSWKKLNASDYYPAYASYQALQKIAGKPKQFESFATSPFLFPDTLVLNSTYRLETDLINKGQSITDVAENYTFSMTGDGFEFFADAVPIIEPNEQATIHVMVKTPSVEGKYHLTFSVTHNGITIPIESKDVKLVSPPSATINVQLGWMRNSNATGATVLLYSDKDTILHKFTDVPIRNGLLSITGLYNVVPTQTYRVVVLVPYYLPRQTFITMKNDNNVWSIKRVYPFDFNRDGKLSYADILALLGMPPAQVFKMFF